MKRLALLVLLLLLIPITSASLGTKANTVEVYFFYGQGCPHCSAAEPFLEELAQKYPQVKIEKFETYFNEENRELFQQTAQAYDTEVKGVPTFFIGEEVIVGYNSILNNDIEAVVQDCIENNCESPSEKINTALPTETSKITIPTLIGAAGVDAINPCTIAVLIILLTTILLAGKRWRILGAGLAFTTAIFISYFLMGLGVFTALQASGLMHIFFYIVVAVAFLVGLLSIKSYFKYKPGVWSVEIPNKWRPLMQKLIKSVTSIPGAAVMGFICSLFLLPCSSGPYLVILGLLAKEATRASAIPLLALYNFIFILPMILITMAVYAGATNVEKVQAWREKYIKLLHLVSGIIMIALASLLMVSMWLGWV